MSKNECQHSVPLGNCAQNACPRCPRLSEFDDVTIEDFEDEAAPQLKVGDLVLHTDDLRDEPGKIDTVQEDGNYWVVYPDGFMRWNVHPSKLKPFCEA